MSAPLGNQFWKQRSSHGRKPIFDDPVKLWEACCEYFQWVEDNPLLEEKIFPYMGENTRVDIHKMRAMTLTALRVFIDMTAETWSQYKRRKDFTEVVSRVEEIIYAQKFEGASSGMLNANIIARDLGLADKKEVGSDPEKPVVVIASEMPADQATALYKTLIDG